jgi:hypothetical protein
MTDLDIQNSRYLLKRFHKKMKFLSSLMTQTGFAVLILKKHGLLFTSYRL